MTEEMKIEKTFDYMKEIVNKSKSSTDAKKQLKKFFDYLLETNAVSKGNYEKLSDLAVILTDYYGDVDRIGYETAKEIIKLNYSYEVAKVKDAAEKTIKELNKYIKSDKSEGKGSSSKHFEEFPWGTSYPTSSSSSYSSRCGC